MQTVHYGRCPSCGAIRGFETSAEALEFEESCVRAHDQAPRAYTTAAVPSYKRPKAYL